MNAKFDVWMVLLFSYFFTLHADQLSLHLGGYTIRANNLFTFSLIGLLIVRAQLFTPRISRDLFLGLLGILCSILISLSLSPFKSRSLLFCGWYGMIAMGYCVLPYLFFQWYGERVFKLYFLSFLIVGFCAVLQLLLACGGIYFFVTEKLFTTLARVNGFAYEPSYYALYLTPFVMMVNFHFLTGSDQPLYCFKRVNKKILFLVNGLYLVSTSTSTVFAYFVFLLILLIQRYSFIVYRRLWLSITALVCLGAGLTLLLPELMVSFYLKFFFSGTSHHSFMERWERISDVWNIFLRHPWCGVGLGGIPSYLLDAWTRGDLAFFSTRIASIYSINGNPLKMFEPSNVFTELLASLGILGVSFFLFLFVGLYKQMKRAYVYQPILASNLWVSLLVTACTLQINQGLFRTYIWVHFALTYALLESMHRDTSELSLEAPSSGI